MSRNITTRTLNPLPFEALEPHRFEDLIRQVAYQFRPWNSILEATGRLGKDEGVDIRAVESSVEESDRTWFIQAKREKSITPKKLRKVLTESFSTMNPYGFILAAACDFSKESRDIFRKEMLERGIKEFHLWGKAEIEDMLFMPQNDHLLFAYFGISIQVRRRSVASVLQHRNTIKTKAIEHLTDLRVGRHMTALIRDPNDTSYPYISDMDEFLKAPRWGKFRAVGHLRVDHVTFEIHSYHAFFNKDTEEWDYNEGHDLSRNHFVRDICGHDDPRLEALEKAHEQSMKMYEAIPSDKKAIFKVFGHLHYDQIYDVDPIGDFYFDGLQILLDYQGRSNPFQKKIGILERPDLLGPGRIRTKAEKRIQHFYREQK